MSLSPTACDRDTVKPLQFADSPAFILPLISQAHERVMPNANVNANAQLDFRSAPKVRLLDLPLATVHQKRRMARHRNHILHLACDTCVYEP